MPEGNEIFRREALERLSSPEQLDELMVVTDSKGWVALTAIGVTLAVALAWSVLGAIPTTIEGSGILLRRGGLYDIQATGSGQVLSLLTAEDSIVREGQVIGYIAQPDLAAQIAVAQQEVQLLTTRHAEESSVQDQALRVTLAMLEQDSVRIAGEISALEAQLAWLRTRLGDTEYARQQGLVTGEAVESVRRQISTAESELRSSQGQLTGMTNRRIAAQHTRDDQVRAIEQQVRAGTSRLQLLTGQLSEADEIQSPYTGRVTALMLDEGQIITAGTTVASLELLGEPLQAVVFVQRVGARAKPGLTAHVQPLTVNWQEHGYLVGTVSYVSMGPVTLDRMNRLLKNDVLSRSLASAGDPYLVEITLDTASTPTGYRWTSGDGPDASEASIHGGIMSTAQIVVDSQRPITLVIPALRKFFGV